MDRLTNELMDATTPLTRWVSITVLFLFLSGIAFWGVFAILITMLIGELIFDV